VARVTMPEEEEGNYMGKCIFCAEELKDQALLCWRCGRSRPGRRFAHWVASVGYGLEAALVVVGLVGLLMSIPRQGSEELAFVAIIVAALTGSVFFSMHILRAVVRLVAAGVDRLQGVGSSDRDWRSFWQYRSGLVSVAALIVALVSLGGTFIWSGARMDQIARQVAISDPEGVDLGVMNSEAAASFERRRAWRARGEFPELELEQLASIGDGEQVELRIGSGEFEALRFSVDSTAEYLIQVDGLGRFDPYLYVFEAQEEGELALVDVNDDSGAGRGALIERLFPMGTYVIVVEEFGGDEGTCVVNVEEV